MNKNWMLVALICMVVVAAAGSQAVAGSHSGNQGIIKHGIMGPVADHHMMDDMLLAGRGRGGGGGGGGSWGMGRGGNGGNCPYGSSGTGIFGGGSGSRGGQMNQGGRGYNAGQNQGVSPRGGAMQQNGGSKRNPNPGTCRQQI